MNETKTHCVVFHRPGTKWEVGVDFREQEGIGAHVGHYARLHQEGKLAMGGPFLSEDRGGMMIAAAEMSQEELDAFAAADPAVQAGLLEYEVVAWYVPMKKE